jgi:UDP-N-acetylglucosamine 1-carboxyvinyltransferase
MDFEITGGKKLSGTITTGYSKNGSVGLLCASLINKGKTTLHGIARIEEVYRVIEILESIGATVDWVGTNSVSITPPKEFDVKKLDREAAEKTRSIIMFIGPLSHALKSFYIPHAHGCHLGKRTIAAHKYALEEMGVNIEVSDDKYQIKVDKFKAGNFTMYEAGDTPVENALTTAALIPGETTIKFTSSNYQVQEICFFLEKCGVKVDGIGTSTLVVHGIKSIDKDVEYHNSEDPIESMTFITAAIATDSTLTIARSPIRFIELELYKLKKMGLKFEVTPEYKAENKKTMLADITVYPSKFKALEDKIHANPYPGINMDNLPYFVIPAIKAKGQTLIHDWTYENRAIYLTELNSMGAKLTLADPHRLYVEGGTKLKAAELVCPPALRPSMVILIAMLAAKGTSILRNVYMINRGYEEIAKRLTAIGAQISVLEK